MAGIPRDQERIGRIREALASNGLDALVCAHPANVLMASGYWPVIGNAIAVATRDGAVRVIAPEDESEMARAGWADEVRTFEDVGEVDERLRETVALRARIGFEGGGCFVASGYCSTWIYSVSMSRMLNTAVPVDATELLGRLRATLTPRELEGVRRACAVAAGAFAAVVPEAGMTEIEVATAMRQRLAGPDRTDGFAWCMSGPNSSRAWKAFQQTGGREIATGDPVLLHCNSYVGGFWTDITRTIAAGGADERFRVASEAVAEARRAALAAIRPGVGAAEVDRAAREVMRARGFGKEFRHPSGHGVGFAAIDHNAHPRIHANSDDTLETGMVFNIEPAAYFEGWGGVRHCDMVAVTATGAELLTPFD